MVSASSPTTGTTSETTRRSTAAWAAASGPATGHGSATPSTSLSALLNRPTELIGLPASRAETDRNASSAARSSSRTDWVKTYTMASAPEIAPTESASRSSSSGAVVSANRNRWAPALTDRLVEARPGVSMTVSARRLSVVRVTST